MKKYISAIVVSMIVGTVGVGTVCAEMNGNLPETPAGSKAPVATAPQTTLQGIPKIEVEFQTGQAEIPTSYSANLNLFGKYMKDNPQTHADIVAYADHTGRAPANAALSQKRADAVRDYLASNFSIASDRLTSHGYGEVTDKIQNSTEAAKQSNRRAFGTISTPKA